MVLYSNEVDNFQRVFAVNVSRIWRIYQTPRDSNDNSDVSEWETTHRAPY